MFEFSFDRWCHMTFLPEQKDLGFGDTMAPATAQRSSVPDKVLLISGANIIEINAVRKHLNRIKLGWLAKAVHPRAHLINLTVADVIGDPLDYITCPTVPDTSRFGDARRTLTKYELWDKVTATVSQHLKMGDPVLETPRRKTLPIT